ncbi:hypothetical protein CQ009_25000 [Pseudomonas sp. MYb2]|nr:hypothetical protein CQ025_26145 [Pseudomonas sp. MYb3]PRC29086.1 hypothetical protein CQ009_25000 [Pseudomonas sp. MYb2]
MTAGGPGKFRWRYGRSRPRRRSKALPLTPTLSPKGARGKGADLQCIQDLSSTPDLLIVPTLRVGTPQWTLRVRFWGAERP